MDTIRFVIEECNDEEFGYCFPGINIYINDRNLIDLVEEVEQRGGSVQPGDSPLQHYIGLPPTYYPDMIREFLGLGARELTTLLVCTCLIDMCNCIRGRITVHPDTVVWSGIKSPLLSSTSPNLWVDFADAEKVGWYPIDYSALGPYVFDRSQYEQALNSLAAP